MEKRGLGKGISALIPQKQEVMDRDRVVLLKLEQIKPNPFQPREEFDAKNLEELVQSIKEKGVIQPILVRKKGDDYELIAGERRLRAAKYLNLNEIPALIKDVEDKESLELSLIENIQRQNLNPIEQAKAFQHLIDKFGITQEKIGQVVGKARVTVTNLLRLLKLPTEIQEEIKKGRLSFAHARTLLEVEEPEVQRELMEEIITKSLSINELDNILRQRYKKGLKRTKKPHAQNPYLLALEEQIQQVLGTRVKIKQGRKRGYIQIEFYSKEDLERILQAITSK